MKKSKNEIGLESKQSLGQLIQSYREQKGISMRELAQELGISFSMVSAVEREKIFPRRRILEKLAKQLEASTSELQKLDTRLRIDHLRVIIQKNPELNDALSLMVKRIREGRASSDEFAKAIIAIASES